MHGEIDILSEKVPINIRACIFHLWNAVAHARQLIYSHNKNKSREHEKHGKK